MCRVYKAKKGWYVRLCCRHDARKGHHIPVPDGFTLQSRHYPKRARSQGRRAHTIKRPTPGTRDTIGAGTKVEVIRPEEKP